VEEFTVGIGPPLFTYILGLVTPVYLKRNFTAVVIELYLLGLLIFQINRERLQVH
jgi:hypothetical protein